MVMVGMVDVAMVAEDVVVQGAVVSGDEDEPMVASQLGTMTMVNMTHSLVLVVSCMSMKFRFPDDVGKLLSLNYNSVVRYNFDLSQVCAGIMNGFLYSVVVFALYGVSI